MWICWIDLVLGSSWASAGHSQNTWKIVSLGRAGFELLLFGVDVVEVPLLFILFVILFPVLLLIGVDDNDNNTVSSDSLIDGAFDERGESSKFRYLLLFVSMRDWQMEKSSSSSRSILGACANESVGEEGLL